MSITRATERSEPRPLRVLLVEDSADDAELVSIALRRGGYDPELVRVDSQAGLVDALQRGPWDVVLSDYSLPGFSGIDALRTLKSRMDGEVPFVIVSGAIGEEGTVEALKAGAGDVVVKGNWARLVPAVEREIRDHVVRRERGEALQALQHAIKTRDDFLSIASHELKTPLTSLQLQVQSLARALDGHGSNAPLDRDRVLRTSKMIVRQTTRLTDLINRMLDISHIASGHLALNRETLDLAALVSEAVERIEEPAAESGTKMTLVTPGPVIGEWDPLRIASVMESLLNNAIKYGTGKPVRVEVKDEGARARVIVVDAGIGIAAKDLERIFERFERAVSVHHYGGFGIGLWTSRQIVEAHGGTIVASSGPGEGATFTMILPKRVPPEKKGVAS